MPTVSVSGSVTSPTGEQVFLTSGSVTISVNLSDVSYANGASIAINVAEAGSTHFFGYDIYFVQSATFSEAIPVSSLGLSPGAWQLSVLVTDYYDNTTESLTNITVVAYNTPQITSWSGYRCNSTGTEDPAGTYVKVLASVTSYGTATITAKAKVKGTSTYVKTTTIPNNTETILSGFDSSSTYIFEAVATDDYGGTMTRSFEIGTQPVPIDFLAGGKGVAIGKVAETEELFDCAWPIKASSIDLDEPIPVESGGTNKSSWTTYRLIYPSSTTAFTQLAHPSTAGSFLRQGTSGAPYWTSPDDVRGVIRSVLRYARTSNQSMTSSSATKISLTSRTEIDDSGILAVSSNGIKVSKTGYYNISAQIIFSATGTAHQATLAINDGTNHIIKEVRTTNSSGSITDSVSLSPTLVNLTANTTIYLYYAGSSGDIVRGTTTITGTKYGTFLQLEFVG